MRLTAAYESPEIHLRTLHSASRRGTTTYAKCRRALKVYTLAVVLILSSKYEQHGIDTMAPTDLRFIL